MSPEPPLTESARRDALIAGWKARLVGGPHPTTMFLISGERGIGKSFLCQGLYRTLAASQPMPAFWPPTLTDPGNPRLEEDRHATRPVALRVPSDARPAFAWVGLSCGRSADGAAHNTLSSGAVQVERLRLALSAVVRGHGSRSS